MGESDERYQRGARKLREVDAGDIVDLPEGSFPFNDVMLRSLSAEVWDRELLDVRTDPTVAIVALRRRRQRHVS